nr:NB-ARC domains-containing protein [Tanacetum cinerariifolium]
MEIASAFVAPVVNALTVHITQKLRYITSSADLVEEMGKKMKVLEGQRTDNKKKMRSNRESRLETPTRVKEWLDEVKKIKIEVDKILSGNPASTSTSDVEDVQEGSDNFPSNDIGCFDVKKKYRTGRDALKLTKDIEALIEESNKMIWRDNQIPLGRVDSKRPASTSSSGGNTQIRFESRDKIFNDALKFLQDDDKTRVIALCGMGGVGKTTLMKQLKVAAKDNKMFSWIVDVGIGKSPNLLTIQQAISAHTGEQLTETNERLMANYLSKRFEAFSENNKKCLVILDDVWKESKIKLEDIGVASPLPKGVKLLLTSRDESTCREIAVDTGFVPEVVRVDVLKEGEARDLFCWIADISAENDRDLYQIGCDIVKKCGYLPLAIEIIAATLIRQRKGVWKRTLKCLKNNKNVLEIIEISYKSLKQEDKAIFLLCGLFPDDSNIPVEDLTRYAWGLELLKEVDTIEDARDSTQTSVSNLKNAYLLMDGDSDDYECVKMHDLVLAFAVATVSKGGEEGCWIIHHDDFSKSSEDVNMSQSCKQISLTCNGMSEFLSEFKFPKLSLLKLMHGDESLRFPQDFYVGMNKLQVIAFQELEYPVVPTSFQCSTNLRTLCLDECSLMFDITCIGNISNLEVLSFANSDITILPSTFRNLKKLRVLDVTEHLSALELEFVGNNGHLKNMSFEKLNRFKLSVGCYYSEVRDEMKTSKVDTHSYLNNLKLVTNREELLKSKINELFKMTDALYLQVNDMNTLEDVDLESPHPRHHPRNSSFYNLRFLVVSECAELKYIFTLNVAKSLSKLEYLDISGCPIIEVIHTENDGSDIIKFSNLKYLRLAELPNLLSFCNNVNILVILDDVWEKIKLEDIGLASPLPNGVKLLLTSRNVQVCRQIAVDADSVPGVVEVLVLKEEEARDLFCRIAGITAEHDRDLYQKGCEIVKKCGCLPLAIKLIAATLTGQKNKSVWNNTLGHSNIAIEDLTRYAWGLKLLNKVYTMEEARDRTKTSVINLQNAYLLMDGDSHHSDCVKLHDLVLVFVVATVSKGGEDGCWIIHHDDFSKWSLASKFRDESLRFPQEFYVGMEKLQVIAFDRLEYPVVPTSFQCSTNLRTLCLHECSLMFDLTCIGELLNLEVLSFANSGITILPSTFRNLKKLRVLDVTGCYNLVIEDDVLKNMVKLEELYMIAFNKKACRFTNNNCDELAQRSEHLSALEFEFIGNNAHMKNMSFEKLNRFKLSVGCYYSEVRDEMKTSIVDTHSYLNNLKLVTNREELLKSKINELFKMTDALYLQVNDMNTLEDVDLESPHPRHHPRNSSFYNLRLLVVSECAELKYLFNMNVATSLSNLEYLDISGCPIIEVIHTENDGSDIIKFSNLKYLRLAELPNLLSFSNNVNVIELRNLVELKLEGLQSFTSIYPSSASSSDATPKLEKLFVSDMENLKEIWPPQFSISNLCLLRELTVKGCDSIEVLFNMDFGKIEQLSSSLRSITVESCKSLVKLFSCNPFPLFNNLQELEV